MNHNLARLVAEAQGWIVKEAVHTLTNGNCFSTFDLCDGSGERVTSNVSEADAWADAPDPLTWAVAGELLEEMATWAAQAQDAERWLNLAFVGRRDWYCSLMQRDPASIEQIVANGVAVFFPLSIVLAYLRWRGVSEGRIREALES